MKVFRKLNDILFGIAFLLLFLLALSVLFPHFVSMIFHSGLSSEPILLYCSFFAILSLISLFKEKLFFDRIPYNAYIIYLMTVFIILILGFFGIE